MMNTDNTIEIERVANGWIIRPSYFHEMKENMTVAVYKKDVFIFETFESMMKWLDVHFTKPEKE